MSQDFSGDTPAGDLLGPLDDSVLRYLNSFDGAAESSQLVSQPSAQFDSAQWTREEINRHLALARAPLAGDFADEEAERGALAKAGQATHQLTRALEVVGLEALAQVPQAVARLLSVLEIGEPVGVAREAARALAVQSIDAVGVHVDALAAGQPLPSLQLLSLYRQLRLACGETVRAADLFYPDLNRRPAELQTANTPLPDHLLAQQIRFEHRCFERGMRAFVADPTSAGAADMRRAVAAIERGQRLPAGRAFWWAATAVFDAVIDGGLAVTPELKQLVAAIERQVRHLMAGAVRVPDALMREVLYHVAIARSGSPLVLAVRKAYELDALLPAQDNAPSDVPEGLAALLSAAQRAWALVSAGEREALPACQSAIEDLIARNADHATTQAGNLELARLLGLALETLAWLQSSPGADAPAPLRAEFDSALTTIERAFCDPGQNDAELRRQHELLAARLAEVEFDAPHAPAALASNAPTQPPASREALLSVARERLEQIENGLQASLHQPLLAQALAALETPIAALDRALEQLGADAARGLLQACAQGVATLAEMGPEAEEAVFPELVHQLAALGEAVAQLANAIVDGDTGVAATARPQPAQDRPAASWPTDSSVASAIMPTLLSTLEVLDKKPGDLVALAALREAFRALALACAEAAPAASRERFTEKLLVLIERWAGARAPVNASLNALLREAATRLVDSQTAQRAIDFDDLETACEALLEEDVFGVTVPVLAGGFEPQVPTARVREAPAMRPARVELPQVTVKQSTPPSIEPVKPPPAQSAGPQLSEVWLTRAIEDAAEMSLVSRRLGRDLRALREGLADIRLAAARIGDQLPHLQGASSEAIGILTERSRDLVDLERELAQRIERVSAMLDTYTGAQQALHQDLLDVRSQPLERLLPRLQTALQTRARLSGLSAEMSLAGGEVVVPTEKLDPLGALLESLLGEVVRLGEDSFAAHGGVRVALEAIQAGSERRITLSPVPPGIDGVLAHYQPRASALRGQLEVTSLKGARALRLVLFSGAAVNPALLLQAGGNRAAIPAHLVVATRLLDGAALDEARAAGVVMHDGEAYPLRELYALLDVAPAGGSRVWLALLRSGERRLALASEAPMIEQDVVLKTVPPALDQVAGLLGVTVFGEDEVVLYVNPLTLAEQIPRSGAEAEALGVPAARPRILVASDSPSTRGGICEALQTAGFDFVVARSRVQALDLLGDMACAAAIIDSDLSEGDGLGLVSQLRAERRFATLPVIMLSSQLAPEHRDAARVSGVDHYLRKPCGQAELLEVLGEGLRAGAREIPLSAGQG